MFGDYTSLISIPGTSNWNTNSTIDMSQLFLNCSSLKSLPDIFKWNNNIDNLIDIKGLYYNCSSLQTLLGT